MQLPAPWVDALFARLTIRYGSAFLRQWPDADPALVKADWADVLGFLTNHPEAIKHALDTLPADKPPTVGQFKAAALATLADARQPVGPALPAPKADPAAVAAAIAAAQPQAPGKSLAQQCIENIERAAEGRLLTASQRHVLESCRRVVAGRAEAA
jgi:hypothetical protein